MNSDLYLSYAKATHSLWFYGGIVFVFVVFGIVLPRRISGRYFNNSSVITVILGICLFLVIIGSFVRFFSPVENGIVLALADLYLFAVIFFSIGAIESIWKLRRTKERGGAKRSTPVQNKLNRR